MAKRDQRGMQPISPRTRPATAAPDKSVPGERNIVRSPGEDQEDNRSAVHDGLAMTGVVGTITSGKRTYDDKA